jgi:hypothetical protein
MIDFFGRHPRFLQNAVFLFLKFKCIGRAKHNALGFPHTQIALFGQALVADGNTPKRACQGAHFTAHTLFRIYEHNEGTIDIVFRQGAGGAYFFAKRLFALKADHRDKKGAFGENANLDG